MTYDTIYNAEKGKSMPEVTGKKYTPKEGHVWTMIDTEYRGLSYRTLREVTIEEANRLAIKARQ